MTDKTDDERPENEISSHQPEIWDIIDPVNRAGRPVAYTPERLWEVSCGYFRWALSKPLLEDKLFGSGLRENVKHPKPFTKRALCVYLEITMRTFDSYCHRAEYQLVTETIKSIMFDQKFSAAAAGMMNPSIVARELGLVDRVAKVTDIQDMTDEQINDRFAELMAKQDADKPKDTMH